MSKKLKNFTSDIDLRSYIMILGLVIIWIIFSVLTEGVFATPRNISNLLRQMSAVAILGIGLVFVILTGEIDLSVGAFVTLTGVIGAVLMNWYGWGTIETISLLIAMGIVAGLIHGIVVVYLKVPSFIATLGAQMIYTGMVLGIGKGISIAPLNASFQKIGQDYISNRVSIILGIVCLLCFIYSVFSSRINRQNHGLSVETMKTTLVKVIGVALIIGLFVYCITSYRGLPVPVLFVLVLTLIMRFITDKTKIGRSIYAVGGNQTAAYCSGINVRKIKIFVFTVSGFMASIAGIILSSRLNAGSAVTGDLKELDAIASAVIGGCSLSGGRGKVAGAILGALIMASLDNGMSLLNIDAFWQYIAKGAILVVAVSLDSFTNKGFE